jgi:hypothetical protein
VPSGGDVIVISGDPPVWEPAARRPFPIGSNLFVYQLGGRDAQDGGERGDMVKPSQLALAPFQHRQVRRGKSRPFGYGTEGQATAAADGAQRAFSVITGHSRPVPVMARRFP